jgi:SAM-dependent methyltransferase
MRWVRKTAGKAQGRKLLDIGCGDGTFLLHAQQQGWQVAGTELKPDIARRAGLDIRTTVAELAELGPFDCITLWHSLEHMADPVATLRSAAALLQPGGFALIAVPDAGGLQASAFAEAWLHLDVPRHLYHFTRASVLRLAETGGLRILGTWHQEFEYDVLGWSQSALNRMSSTLNVFFDQLRGRPPAQGTLPRILNGAGGMVLSACALPLVLLGTLLGRGGTLVLAAQKTGIETP